MDITKIDGTYYQELEDDYVADLICRLEKKITDLQKELDSLKAL